MRFLSPLMGVNFRPAEVREFVKSGDIEQHQLTLERDPENQYDANAIKVMAGDPAADPEFVGFVAKEVAEELAPLLDSGWSATVEVIGWLGTIKPHLEIVATLAEEPKEYKDLPDYGDSSQ